MLASAASKQLSAALAVLKADAEKRQADEALKSVQLRTQDKAIKAAQKAILAAIQKAASTSIKGTPALPPAALPTLH